ncbi:hypothetical protein CI109_106650 [Kwoniella shandongensis]|uniref:Uncharacterized protein n=1 Tax=Kwoniella shandongensis TaxID=1734106 RepID=A0A5M6BP09_9TREE|nr:uncharacterized protein CI109_007213 [Kwoniella shandongensis]KAA5524463.1 hypothetical protein CI109_007213 [Kwoniella shandongensis]
MASQHPAPSRASSRLRHHPSHLSDELQPTEPIEPTFATGAVMMAHAEHGERSQIQGKSPLVLKRLRKEMPLPGVVESRVMLGVLFLVMFLAGWNDASQGPLLPTLQEYYHVNYLVIATIWIASCVGFIASGVANVYISDRFGFGITAPFGAFMGGVAYVLMCWGPPFPLFVIAFIPNGFGLGLQDAQVNSLTTRLPNAITKMFLMHAMYGFGATVSPFVSTAFVQHVGQEVYYYYAVSLGLALITVAALLIVFKLRTEEQIVGHRAVEGQEAPLSENEKAAGERRTVPVSAGYVEGAGGSSGKMKQILKTPSVHFMAFYILIYVGVEVMIGGWATSFLIDERGGDSNAGYVSAGYFGGITIGRIILIPVTHKLGHHLSIWVYSIFAIVLSVIIWVTHSIVANSICFSLVGVFLGPLYPIVMNVVAEIIPGELQGGSIGWIASLGQAGSAMMPFIAGAISERYGVWILQPVTIAFLAFSLVLWFFVTRASPSDRSFWPQWTATSTETKDGSELSVSESSGDATGKENEKGQRAISEMESKSPSNSTPTPAYTLEEGERERERKV